MGSGRNERRLAGYTSAKVVRAADKYQTIAANNAGTNAAVVLGGGHAGDYLDKLLCVVTDVNNAQVGIKDGGGGEIVVLPKVLAAGNTTHRIELGLTAVNNWQVTTGLGVAVVASGIW